MKLGSYWRVDWRPGTLLGLNLALSLTGFRILSCLGLCGNRRWYWILGKKSEIWGETLKIIILFSKICVNKLCVSNILFDRANYTPYFTHKQTKAQQGSCCVQVTCLVIPEPCQLCWSQNPCISPFLTFTVRQRSGEWELLSHSPDKWERTDNPQTLFSEWRGELGQTPNTASGMPASALLGYPVHWRHLHFSSKISMFDPLLFTYFINSHKLSSYQ